MKRFALLLAALLPTFGMASNGYFNHANSYTCHRYTDNEVDGDEITDNPQQLATTKITESINGYVIKKGEVFKDGAVLSKDPTGRYHHVAYNQTLVMNQKRGGGGRPYFIFYFFKQGASDPVVDPRKNITRLVVIADCDI